jgi:hypothetical protein
VPLSDVKQTSRSTRTGGLKVNPPDAGEFGF